MPHYDYKCGACGNVFEVFQSMTDALLKKCPDCGGDIKRLISGGGGIIFKGNGFYSTDHRKTETPCAHQDAKAPACGCGGECRHA